MPEPLHLFVRNFNLPLIYTHAAPIVVTVTGSGATQNAGENYTLTCTVSGGGTTTTTYLWLRNNSLIAGETSDTLSFTPLRQTSPTSNGQYICQAMRSGRTVSSESFSISLTSKIYSQKLNLTMHTNLYNSASIDTGHNSQWTTC